jgi:NAD(P)-dependent dehydrogenase (short-subunit alcohol dehydrogenase family)
MFFCALPARSPLSYNRRMSVFTNRVALVTGAGSGLGRQLALALAAEGAAVAALDLNAAGLAALGGELAGKPYAWAVADVTDLPGLRQAAKGLEARLGPVDLLIANAGIGRETSALDFRAEDVEAIIRVNLVGVANSIDAVLPGMLARRRGHLAAISSLASYRGLPRMAGYCAAKAGVNALLEGLRVELAPLGIAVTTICPGWVRTPMTAAVNLPMPNLMDADAAARVTVAALKARRPFVAFPSGSVRHVRLLRWLPAAWSDWLLLRAARKMEAR